MHLPTILSVSLSLLPLLTLALPTNETTTITTPDPTSTTTSTPTPNPTPLPQNTCWNDLRVRCPGRSAPLSTARSAISLACSQIPPCVPDPARSGKPVPRYFGKVPGYTARIDVGWNCAGVVEWTEEKCWELFVGRIDGGCGDKDVDTFELGYTGASCDGSYLSFNLEG